MATDGQYYLSSNEESEYELESDEQVDEEDYGGASLDDVYQDMQNPQKVAWPNDAYREFMELICKHRLPNSAGDSIIKFFDKFSGLNVSPLPTSTNIGRQFLDNADIRYTSFKDVTITTFQDIEYTLHYRPIIQAVKSLLVIDSINQNFALNYVKKWEMKNGIEHQIYEEQYNCDWWWQEESNLIADRRLLSLIFYSDATTLDHMGKSSGHPLFISLGNIPNFQRNKPESKALVAYLPILKPKDNKTKNSDGFRKLQRNVFQRCLRVLIEPILRSPELYFVIRGEAVAFTPRISVILADMPEADKYTNVYQPSSSKRPCGSCLVLKNDLNNTELNILPRTIHNMKQAIENDEAHEHSIHPEPNIFWQLRNFNIYQAVVPDRMHMLDLGLFKYMLDYTKKLLNEQCGGWAVQTIEQRLTSIPRFHGLKIMKNVSDMTRMTADELRNIMKVIVIVLDNLYQSEGEEVNNERLCGVFHKFLKMYLATREESFTSDSCDQLQV